jgi:SAM-dependent methyltransferase
MSSWYGLYEYRKQIRKKFPSFWRVKITKKPFDVVYPFLNDNMRVLDVGSGNRNMESKLKNKCKNIVYKSMDIDKDRFHDYYSLDDIKEKFNLVLLFEVIEHLEFEEAVSMLKKIKNILLPEGRFILTTPNVFHPNRYWEYSHKVAYRYDELAGLLMSLGYEIENIYRVYNAPLIQRFIRLYIMAPIHHYFSIDFARSIVIVAKNK